MIRFIWNNWWRHRERFILLIVGALIIGSGLSYLVGLSQSNKGTVVKELERHWTSSYDIVVRPMGTRSSTETDNLMEPNYLSGLQGGISLDQYKTIQKIEGVRVAAPISMIGYAYIIVNFPKIKIKGNGLYRLQEKSVTDIGSSKYVETNNFYFPNNTWSAYNKDPDYGVGVFEGDLNTTARVLLAGIDPVQEAKLVGLDKATLNIGESRYFNSNDKSYSELVSPAPNLEPKKETYLPVFISSTPWVDKSINFTIQRLDLPFNNSNQADKTMEMVKNQGGRKYLDSVPVARSGKEYNYSFSFKKTYEKMIEQVTGVNPNTGKPSLTVVNNIIDQGISISQKPSPLDYQKATSPFSNRWPISYNLRIPENSKEGYNLFRPTVLFSENSYKWPQLFPKLIGFYDPERLKVPKDPLTQLPMETYRPASAKLVLDNKREAVNPPISIKPTDEAYDLLTQPPAMLTTIEAASEILGKKPISAIRIKVDGVEHISKQSQQKLERIAHEIREKTGLITDITLGSSPQSVLTHVPASGKEKALGWIEQPWINIGSSFTIFQQTQLGFSSIIASVMVVAIVYVLASNLVSLFARRKEFAVLLSVGWRPNQLAKLLFIEATFLGSFVAIITWFILGLVLSVKGTEISPTRFILSGLFGLVIYWLGAIGPALLTKKIRPYEAMRTGEIAGVAYRFLRTRGRMTMAINHFIGKWKRGVLSIIAMALPTALLSLFLFITFKLKGTMFTSWLGQYVAVEVGASHFIAMAVAFVIAILTTAEIMWQNIMERQPEIALLKSVGWRNNHVRMLILWEGILSGIIAGIIGLLVSILIIGVLYKQFPTNHLWFIVTTGVIPVVAGVLGAVPPAEKAVRIQPAQAISTSYSNQGKTEKLLKWSMGILIFVLLSGLVFVVIRLINH